jgi:Nif-specific regulatory protein
MSNQLSQNVEVLSDVARSFAESLALEPTLESILYKLESHLKLVRGTITLFDPDTETINIEVAHGLTDESKKLGSYEFGEGVTGTVVQTGEAVVIPDIAKDPRFLDKTGARVHRKGQKVSFICVPIKLEGSTIGALSVDRKTKSGEDFESNLQLLQIITTMIAQAVKLNRLVESDKLELRSENKRLRQELKQKFNVHNMIGTSNAMKEVYGLIEQVANSNATVLIRGESGTGKDLVAHAIHYNSMRSEKPFIKINCTALPETLLESELFGHEKGSFTGAIDRKIGRFEMAHGGTIFLDEIGDFSMNLQVKLLRVMQFKEFERVGGHETIKANVRIVVATNKNLEKEIKEGLFREDLYYRINVFPIFLPALRERKNDVMLLADTFLEKYAKENGKAINRISTPAIKMLTSYHWPGNVRELENCLERAVLLCNDDVVRSEHLPPSLQMVEADDHRQRRTFTEIVENLERELIVDALKRTGGHQRKAAKELALTERILGYKIKKYEVLPSRS